MLLTRRQTITTVPTRMSSNMRDLPGAASSWDNGRRYTVARILGPVNRNRRTGGWHAPAGRF
ncbi:hypothetical protein ACTI_40620 [Actinoplanes sp. OR16]|nr:hypothetical protein ACTI_40620 [Actinoplanes sp. OR16]